MPDTSEKPRVLFIYPDPPGYSGQRSACELTISILSCDYRFTSVKIPGVPHVKRTPWLLARFAVALLMLFPRLLFASWGPPDIVIFAVCQTRPTIIRDRIVIALTQIVVPTRVPTIMPLHSNVFLLWRLFDPMARSFRKLLSRADIAIALGPKQHDALTSYICPNKIEIISNTCECDLISEQNLAHKFDESRNRLNVLHLGTLMEPKGYVEVLEAAKLVRCDTRVTICGRVAKTKWDVRFSSTTEAEEWLDEQGSSESIRIITGATGGSKTKLYVESHVFVLPTSYPVESQPLVLLEAMASGCAIITTRVGEIPYMLDDTSCLFLDDVSPAGIARTIEKLYSDRVLCRRLGENARSKYMRKFGKAANAERWRTVINKCLSRV